MRKKSEKTIKSRNPIARVVTRIRPQVKPANKKAMDALCYECEGTGTGSDNKACKRCGGFGQL